MRHQYKRKGGGGDSLVIQWLGLSASPAGGPGSIPGLGTKILHVCDSGKKKKKYVTTSPLIYIYIYLYIPPKLSVILVQ